jgi:hypothetical protein
MDNLVLAERAHFFSTSKYIFMKEKISILETRERFRLSLRKEKLDDYFQMKRIETFNFSRKSELEVVMKEICEKLEEASDLSSTATMLIESSNLNVIKSTVYYLRRKFSYQKFLNEFKSKQKFHLNSEIICQLLNCLEKYEDEKEILVYS